MLDKTKGSTIHRVSMRYQGRLSSVFPNFRLWTLPVDIKLIGTLGSKLELRHSNKPNLSLSCVFENQK